MLICIVGMDGSGKSTLAGGLVRALEARGVRARYTYGRYQPRALAVVFKLLGGGYCGGHLATAGMRAPAGGCWPAEACAGATRWRSARSTSCRSSGG